MQHLQQHLMTVIIRNFHKFKSSCIAKVNFGVKQQDVYEYLHLLWLFTYCPTARGLVGYAVNQEMSHKKWGPSLSLPAQDLFKAKIKLIHNISVVRLYCNDQTQTLANTIEFKSCILMFAPVYSSGESAVMSIYQHAILAAKDKRIL